MDKHACPTLKSRGCCLKIEKFSLYVHKIACNPMRWKAKMAVVVGLKHTPKILHTILKTLERFRCENPKIERKASRPNYYLAPKITQKLLNTTTTTTIANYDGSTPPTIHWWYNLCKNSSNCRFITTARRCCKTAPKPVIRVEWSTTGMTGTGLLRRESIFDQATWNYSSGWTGCKCNTAYFQVLYIHTTPHYKVEKGQCDYTRTTTIFIIKLIADF